VVRLPSEVVEALNFREGDQIDIRIYSEDLQDGQIINRHLTIRNPFR